MGVTKNETQQAISGEVPKHLVSDKSSKLYSRVDCHKDTLSSFGRFKARHESGELSDNAQRNLNTIVLENLLTHADRKSGKDLEAAGSDLETDELLHTSKQHKELSLSHANSLRRAVVIISWLSLVVLFGLGIITLVIGIVFNSPSSFAFALDALLDCFSSAVIIWRFYSPDAINSYNKEKKCVISLGALFILSAFTVIARSSEAIKDDVRPTQDSLIWYMATVDGLVCLFLFIGYLYIATKLRTVSLLTDAIIALMGSVLAVATLTGDLVYEHHDNIWYLDPLLGIIAAVFMLIYGVVIIIYEVRCHKNEDHCKDISEESS